MPLNGAILHIGGQSFELSYNAEITANVRTGYILDGSGDTFTSIFQSLAESSGLFEEWSLREGIYLDLGGGERVVEIEFENWSGSDILWGDAAGESAMTQMDVLHNALVTTQIDSFRPATLEYGEFSRNGRYDPMDCAIESPAVNYDVERPSSVTGNITAIAVATFDEGVYGDALSLLG